MNSAKRTFSTRDYRKPVRLRLRGKKGLETYAKIVTSPKIRYDANAAAEKAAENLRKQGMEL